jgi:hypothetical protein
MKEAMIVSRVFSNSGLKIKPKFWSSRKFWTDLPTSFYQSCNKISRNCEKKTSSWRNNSETNHNSPKSPTDLIFLRKYLTSLGMIKAKHAPTGIPCTSIQSQNNDRLMDSRLLVKWSIAIFAQPESGTSIKDTIRVIKNVIMIAARPASEATLTMGLLLLG